MKIDKSALPSDPAALMKTLTLAIAKRFQDSYDKEKATYNLDYYEASLEVCIEAGHPELATIIYMGLSSWWNDVILWAESGPNYAITELSKCNLMKAALAEKYPDATETDEVSYAELQALEITEENKVARYKYLLEIGYPTYEAEIIVLKAIELFDKEKVI